MHIHLIAVGQKMPAWVKQGYEEYAKRLPQSFSLKLTEIAPGQRSKRSDPRRAIEEEGAKIINAIPAPAHVIALDEGGKQWTTLHLAEQMQGWMQDGRDIALLVGGADGLSHGCKQRAEQRWALSKLTLPHPLVRVLLAEQLYRAWSVTQGHPYHRE
ncbi:50S rRNA methyltransferase [Candidatus Tenderia electrophaga]|jgi:23S rRNA (pseudouridine1915-N3)-methyltransferase|uniref:Ribosomal RNA large subunit methyltransferase H n=1 Tax=Candidatus Tenderia electrophaga TaxID=1748243 RepID=A0A0S2TA62_9GAMM|nr:50S rRNA methyltransferase [Candidatus Tenderia electrophaga]